MTETIEDARRVYNSFKRHWILFQEKVNIEHLTLAYEYCNEFFDYLDNFKDEDGSLDTILRKSEKFMEKDGMWKAYQMNQFYMRNKEGKEYSEKEEGRIVIEIYDMIKEHEDEINSLAVEINEKIPPTLDEDFTNAILDFRVICFFYHSCYSHIRHLFVEEHKETNQNPTTDCGKLPKELNTPKARELFGKISSCEKDGDLYKWTGSASLFGYFVDRTSDFLYIRPSNNRMPWKIYQQAFQISESSISTAKSAVKNYTHNGKSEPEGFYEIKQACL